MNLQDLIAAFILTVVFFLLNYFDLVIIPLLWILGPLWITGLVVIISAVLTLMRRPWRK